MGNSDSKELSQRVSELESKLRQSEVEKAELLRKKEQHADNASRTRDIMTSVKRRLDTYKVNVSVVGFQASGKTSFICSAIKAFEVDIQPPSTGANGRTTRHIAHYSLANLKLIDIAGINHEKSIVEYMRAVQSGANEQPLVRDNLLIPAEDLTYAIVNSGTVFQWIIVLDGTKLFSVNPHGNDLNDLVASKDAYGEYLKAIYTYTENQHDVVTVVVTMKDKLENKNVTFEKAYEAAASMFTGLARDRFFWMNLRDPKDSSSVLTTAQIFDCIVGRKVIQ